MTWNMLHSQSKPAKRLIMSPPKEAIKWCELHVGRGSACRRGRREREIEGMWEGERGRERYGECDR